MRWHKPRSLLIPLFAAIPLLALPALPAFGQERPRPTAEGDTVAVADSVAPQARPRRRRSPSLSNVGYIDNAVVGNQFQLRVDRADGVNRPDRAEFFYGKCGCFREVGLDPEAPGPTVELAGRDPATTPFIVNDLKYVDVVVDGELALSGRFSLFAEVTFRFADLAFVGNESGIADISVGAKAALVAKDRNYLTFQVRMYVPTGDAERGLGTDHVSLEPALLSYNQLSERVKLEAELRYWIPIDGSSGRGAPGFDEDDDFNGGVIRYGVGLGVDLSPNSPVRFTPVVEVVGWSVLGGLASVSTDGTASTFTVDDAEGTTIVNLKAGARFGFGESHAIYVGLGIALTGDVWYDNILRVEYRLGL